MDIILGTRNKKMIHCEEVKPRMGEFDKAYVIHYSTPKGKGSERFGGYLARLKATKFAVEKLKELLDN